DLERAGELENTFILFVSDNGACPYERRCNKIDQLPCTADVTWNDSTGWAWMRNAPFRYYKQNQYEGGICTPAIVHWPAGLKTIAGSITRSPAHLIDVLPTLSDICQAPIPTEWPGRKVKPVSGVSLRPIFETGKLTDRPPIHLLFSSDRGLRDGDWKLVSFRREPWELYNLASDRTEQYDLADKHPERLQKMIDQWHTMALEVLEVNPKTAQPVKTEASPHQHPQWTDYNGVPRNRIGVQAQKR
ncbi:MAG: sulfatase-like hydrolase/transferase, partial [Cyanobacteria bacterium P01_E01_bin.48]